MSRFLLTYLQQLNIKYGNKAKHTGRIAWVCFLLESTAMQRHHKHLKSCAIFTGAFTLFRPHGLELLEETLFLFSLPASSVLLCLLPMKEPHGSRRVFSTCTWHTLSAFHLTVGFPHEPLNFLTDSFKPNPLPPASETHLFMFFTPTPRHREQTRCPPTKGCCSR